MVHGETAVGFSLDCKINDRRAMVVQVHLPLSAKPKEINDILERLVASADRLELRYRLIDMRFMLKKLEEELPQRRADLVVYEEQTMADHKASGRKQEFRWQGAALTNRRNHETNIKGITDRIKMVKEGIAEAEAELKE